VAENWAVAGRILAVLLVSAFAMGCGGHKPRERRVETNKTPRAAPAIVGLPGRLVGIGGGRSLFLHCVGAGEPAVVLEAGAGGDSSNWREVQPQLGRITRTCAYDRAGAGNSVAPAHVRDARDEIADLRQLLGRAHVDPPYVLVGHSYGAVLGRVFAHLDPTETAGLVLIDTMGRDGRRRQLVIWPRSQATGLRAELATRLIDGVDLGVGEALASRVRTLGDMPLAVITAGRQDNFPRTPAQLARALERLWSRMQDELAGLSDNSVHVVALRSDHDVLSAHSGQPSVVVGAVQAVVRAARERTHLPPCPRIFSGANVRCRS
jgi:pimeloyl-ACP methyl ester carboxylesterase